MRCNDKVGEARSTARAACTVCHTVLDSPCSSAKIVAVWLLQSPHKGLRSAHTPCWSHACAHAGGRLCACTAALSASMQVGTPSRARRITCKLSQARMCTLYDLNACVAQRGSTGIPRSLSSAPWRAGTSAAGGVVAPMHFNTGAAHTAGVCRPLRPSSHSPGPTASLAGFAPESGRVPESSWQSLISAVVDPPLR